MKALSVRQPWANMIADGVKTIELRKWETKHRGLILIVSMRVPYIEPAGRAVAVAYLTDCRPAVKGDEKKACCPIFKGAWAWEFSTISRIRFPFKITGRQYLFDVDYDPKVADLKVIY